MPTDLTEVTIQDVYAALSNDASRNAMIADDIVRAIESLRRFLRVTRACFPKVTHLACNQDCN